ncbi:hypothetical protein NQ317_000723 [Molorchus minor]|uniref:Endonuclease/exonuclease/phosphatase domain-containing protein n=1 Tax=Molorchus minor TaxID=1323400 RepID=A0ABQ9IZD9_9CUCU|nr:hypothetical protein NQ317_000723 [Molorchus minor]
MDPYIRNFVANVIKTENVLTALRKKNFTEVEIFLKQFTNLFDCIICTETWQIPNIKLIQLEEYTTIYNEASYNQCDGTIIFIRNNIEHVDFNFQKISDISLINLTFCLNNKLCNIYAMYRPPSTNINDYIDALEIYLQHQNLNYDHNIFVGDINIDILGKSLESENYLNTLAEFGFHPVINDYTRIQGDSKSCLDHIFIRSKGDFDDLILPLIVQTSITDHFPVLFQLVTGGLKNNIQYKENIIKHINYDKLRKQLSDVDWSDVYNLKDVESATKAFLSIIENKITLCTKVTKIKNSKYKRKCWITNGIIKSIQNRDKLFREVQLEPLNEDLKQRYREYRNKLTALIKKTKISYFKSKINKNANCSKNLWSTVKEMCNSNNSQTNITKIQNDSNEIITDKLEISNTFNNTFSSIGENMAKEIKSDTPQNGNGKVSRLENVRSCSTFESFDTSGNIFFLDNRGFFVLWLLYPWNYNLEMSLLYLGDKIPKLYRLSGAETLGRIPTYQALYCEYVCVTKERCEPVTGAPQVERTTYNGQ